MPVPLASSNEGIPNLSVNTPSGVFVCVFFFILSFLSELLLSFRLPLPREDRRIVVSYLREPGAFYLLSKTATAKFWYVTCRSFSIFFSICHRYFRLPPLRAGRLAMALPYFYFYRAFYPLTFLACGHALHNFSCSRRGVHDMCHILCFSSRVHGVTPGSPLCSAYPFFRASSLSLRPTHLRFLQYI